MITADIAASDDAGVAAPGDGAEVSTLLGRKSVLMWMAATMGIVVANTGQPSAAASATVSSVSTWAPSTAYALGQQIINPNNDVVAAKAAHTSSAVYATDMELWTLSNTFGRLDQRTQPVYSQGKSFAKGKIGLSGRTPIALRFDDWQDYFRVNVQPLLAARQLVASLACISHRGAQPWFVTTTWNDIRAWKLAGLEIWSHGTDHHNPAPNGYAGANGLLDQIVQSKADLEAQNLRVHGWAMPGAPGTLPYGSYLYTLADWESDAGRLVQATYGLVETDMTGPFRHLPSDLRYGLAHATISDDAAYRTFALTKTLIDQAVASGLGLEMMCHAGNLDTASHMTLADFTAVLDYLVTLRNQGVIEVVTPSALAYCDPNSTTRLDLLANGDFSNMAATGLATDGVWQNIDGVNNLFATVGDNPRGRTGPVLRIATTNGTPVVQSPKSMQQRFLNGQTLMFQGKARGVGGAATVNIRLEALRPYAVEPVKYPVTLTTAWQTIRMPYTPHVTTDVMGVSLTTTAGVAELTDIHLFVA
jgi:hypothetical protein